MKLLTFSLMVLISISCLKKEENKQQPEAQRVSFDPITGQTVMTAPLNVPIKIKDDSFTVLKPAARTLKHESNECTYKMPQSTTTYDVVGDELFFSSGTRL